MANTYCSDITNDIQLGARYQHDDVRGSQTYLEATIRFPFDHKKSFKEEGVRSRLDEAPERDIDIVSNESVIDEGLKNTTLLNAQTGLVQNILHVDNTAGGGGDGSIETPYNTLAAAEGAAGVNDLIYVHRGDGTTTGQNAGITLDDAGQMLAGSGADLTFDFDRFKTANGMAVSQTIIPKTEAPIITNGAGDGVSIAADEVHVSGITVSGTSGHGIFAQNSSNTTWNKVTIDGVTTKNTVLGGIEILTSNDNSDILNATIKNAEVYNAGGNGIDVNGLAGGDYNKVVIQDSKVLESFRGIRVRAGNNSLINSVDLSNITVTRNERNGLQFTIVGTGTIKTFSIEGASTTQNGGNGVRFGINTMGKIEELSLLNMTVTDNEEDGIDIFIDENASLEKFELMRSTMRNNNDFGFKFEDLSADKTPLPNIQIYNAASGNTLGDYEIIN